MRKSYPAGFKAKVALAAIRPEDTIAEISSKYEVHRVQIMRWKKEVLTGLSDIFSKGRGRKKKDDQALTEELYSQTGRLKVENDRLKKILKESGSDRRSLTDRGFRDITVTRQCGLLNVSEGALYYEPVGIDPYSPELMDLIDRQFTETPFYGSRRMTARLRRQGHQVSRKRVRRLMGLMRPEAVYPKPDFSRKRQDHGTYPCLLRGVRTEKADQVWSTDITCIRAGKGFVCLTAVIGRFSRYVLSWKLSGTPESDFCAEALNDALMLSVPEIFNTGQGSQHTSERFLNPLKDNGTRISMDSKGRALDNIFVERLWRTVKYEEVYIREYSTAGEARSSLKKYFEFYNNRRLHQSLDYMTPAEVYYQRPERRGSKI